MTGHFAVTEQQASRVLELFQTNQHIGQIAETTGLDRHAVSQVLKENPGSGYDPRTSRRHKYFFDERFFQTIDTEEKAYFFGWLASDGWIKMERGHALAVCLEIHRADCEIVEAFSRCLGSQAPQPVYRPSLNKVKLVFHSTQMCRDLAEKGLGHDKTFALGDITRWVPQPLQRHFVRGVFDGDGHWTDEPYRLRWGIRGTEAFLAGLQSIVPVPCIIAGRRQWKTLTNTRHAHGVDFGYWIYNNADFYLRRKYVKFHSAVER